MYEKALSNRGQAGESTVILEGISPTIQNDIIMQQSGKAWGWLSEGLDKIVVDCSDEDARSVNRLFEQLALLFRARL